MYLQHSISVHAMDKGDWWALFGETFDLVQDKRLCVNVPASGQILCNVVRSQTLHAIIHQLLEGKLTEGEPYDCGLWGQRYNMTQS